MIRHSLKRFLILIGIMGYLCCNNSFGQPLKKGEQLPYYEFNYKIGDSSFSASLNDYHDKYLLIDFWDKYCADCIAAMPDLLAMQEKYKDKLIILLVTQNTGEEIEKFFLKFRDRREMNKRLEALRRLQLVTNDSFLTALLPHRGFPSHAWIGTSLTFVGMAYSTSFNDENIKEWTSGKDVRLDEMITRDISFLDPIAVMTAANEFSSQRKNYSILLNRIEYGMASGWITDIYDSASNKQVGISCINSTIPELYNAAYKISLGVGAIIPDYRIIWNISKSTSLSAPRYSTGIYQRSQYFDWVNDNTFCYLLKIDPSIKQNFYSIMKTDLDKWFGFRSAITEIKIKCRILKQLPGTKAEQLLRNKVGLVDKDYSRTDQELIIHNSSLKQLYSAIRNISDRQKWKMPFLNETVYKGRINIRLFAEKGLFNLSLNDLNAQLKKYGLIITQEYRLQKMLVVNDIKK